MNFAYCQTKESQLSSVASSSAPHSSTQALEREAALPPTSHSTHQEPHCPRSARKFFL